MRKNAADALFPGVRRDVLSATFRDPKRWWYLSELAEALGTSPSSLQRELESLAATSILERRREGRRTYYRAHHSVARTTTIVGANAGLELGLEYFTRWHFSVAIHSSGASASWGRSRDSIRGDELVARSTSTSASIGISPVLFVRGYF